MSLTAGTHLGPYDIVGELGAGGMGEVYKARDTRLDRTVAIKVLPSAMAVDPERRARFEREAKAVAALNHPNIVTIHAVEEVDGLPFFTMEYVEGQTLAHTIPPRGFPLDALLRIATPITDAIGAAHQRGILHRDMKPANVMLTPEGRVKVLDFGLAKLGEAATNPDARMQPTVETTGEGRVLGTVAYMSPEQAEGKDLDQRSDVFSLGVLLFEMATGQRPFKGDTSVSVISSILKDSPSSVTDLRPDLPRELARILKRALNKDPEHRYQTAKDLRNDLQELKQDLDRGVDVAPRVAPARKRGARWLAIGGGIAILVGIAAGLFAWLRPPSGARLFTVERLTRLTDSGAANLAALSRDGRWVVHAKIENGRPGIWVRQTATTSDIPVVAPADGRLDSLAFSPDGTYVYYVAYPMDYGAASLYRVPVLGGAPIRVLEDIDSAPAFSPDGRRMAFIRGDVVRGIVHLMVASVDGTGARTISTGTASVRFTAAAPAWSPDGRTLLAIARDRVVKGIVVAIDAATGTLMPVGGDWRRPQNLQWMPDGRSFLIVGIDRVGTVNSQIWQVDYPSGERRRITNDLASYAGVSLAADGSVLATVQAAKQARIWVGPAGRGEGKEMRTAPGRTAGVLGVSWTPEGRLVFAADAGGASQLWIAGVDGSDPRQLTSGEMMVAHPAVSPDGRWIYYTGQTSEGTAIWRMGIDGADQRTLTRDTVGAMPIPSPDGRWVYFMSGAEPLPETMRMPASGGDASVVTSARFAAFDISADGRELIGIAWNEAKQRPECGILPIGGGPVRLLDDVSRAAGVDLQSWRFHPAADLVSYAAMRDGVANLFAQPIAGGVERQITRFSRDTGPEIFYGAWSRDGRVALSRGITTSDVVLISAK